MKIEVLQEQLLAGLSVVSRAVATKAQLPVLSHVLIEARQDGVVLSATDLEIGIRVKVAAKVIEEGKIAVPAKMFGEFLSSINPGKVNLVEAAGNLSLVSGAFKSKFQTIAAEEFPIIAELSKESELAELKTGELTAAIERVVFASAKDSLRPVLTGVLWEVSLKKIRLVATDGFRLAIEELKIQTKAEELSLLVPSRVMSEVEKLSQGEETIKFGHIKDSNQVYFKIGEIEVVSQLLSGNYPDYGKILPKEFASEVTIGREELLQAVRAAHIFARDNSNMIKLSIEESQLILSSSSPERGECNIEVPISLSGDKLEIIFNAKYILDYLSIVDSSSLWIGLGTKLSPAMIKDTKRESGQYVVMPINA